MAVNVQTNHLAAALHAVTSSHGRIGGRGFIHLSRELRYNQLVLIFIIEKGRFSFVYDISHIIRHIPMA